MCVCRNKGKRVEIASRRDVATGGRGREKEQRRWYVVKGLSNRNGGNSIEERAFQREAIRSGECGGGRRR